MFCHQNTASNYYCLAVVAVGSLISFKKKTFMMTGAWEKTSSSEEPDTVRRQSRRRSLRRRKVAQELDAQPSFGSADSPDHQIRIGNLVLRLIFAMMVAQVVAHRTKDRLRFTLLAGLFSLFSFLFLNQWCILYQEPHRGASLLLFWFPKNMLSSAAWGKASSMGNEWEEKRRKYKSVIWFSIFHLSWLEDPRGSEAAVPA